MLQGASEEHKTGQHIFLIGNPNSRAVCSLPKVPKVQDIHQKAKQMKMLSKGTFIQKLKYYYLSSSSCFWISFMAIRRIFKDNPKMCHITEYFTAYTWSVSFACVNFWLKTKWLSFIHSLITRFINL